MAETPDLDLKRRICLSFLMPPSFLGIDDPLLESTVRLRIQRDGEERILRQSPGDFAAIAARVEDHPNGS